MSGKLKYLPLALLLSLPVSADPKDVDPEIQSNLGITGVTGGSEATLVLERLGSIRDEDGRAGFDANSRICRTERGEFVLAPIAERGRIAVFGSEGRLKRIVGRRGAGPGEFQSTSLIVPSEEDEIIVVDWRLNRVTRLTTRGRLRDSFQLPGRAFDLSPLSGGYLVMQMNLLSEERVGLPLHVVNWDGTILRSFGAEKPDYQDWNADVYRRHIASTSHGVWAARLNEYRLELWDPEGNLLRSLTRDVDWFEVWTEVNRESFYKSRPETRTAALRVNDDDELAWLLFTCADDDWRPLAGEVPSIQSIGVAEAVPVFDWIVEVVDTADELLVASHRFDGPVQLVEPGLIAKAVEDDMGAIRFDLYRASVRSH